MNEKLSKSLEAFIFSDIWHESVKEGIQIASLDVHVVHKNHPEYISEILAILNNKWQIPATLIESKTIGARHFLKTAKAIRLEGQDVLSRLETARHLADAKAWKERDGSSLLRLPITNQQLPYAKNRLEAFDIIAQVAPNPADPEHRSILQISAADVEKLFVRASSTPNGPEGAETRLRLIRGGVLTGPQKKQFG